MANAVVAGVETIDFWAVFLTAPASFTLWLPCAVSG